MNKTLNTLALIFLTFSLAAQENLPTDYLTPAFHKGRREAFRALMPAGSVALIFAFPERTFSKDVDHPYHQNPDLYYLSGYGEPDALLILFKDMQGQGDTAYNELFFVRKRDPLQETWTGRRLGVEGVKNKLGFKRVFEGKDFASYPIDFSKYSVALGASIPNDVKSDETGSDLLGLMKSAKAKGFKESANPDLDNIKQMVSQRATYGNRTRIIAFLNRPGEMYENFRKDPEIAALLSATDSASYEKARSAMGAKPSPQLAFTEILNTLREIKTPEEMDLVRKSARISALAHSEVMKAVTPDMSEHQAEGIQTYVHKYYGAEEEGYPPIVGAGGNGCILHYEENSATKIDNQLLLMDVACMYHGYSADVTRAIPANGKFTTEQKAIYQLVYDAQEATIGLCREGATFQQVEAKAREVLTDGMLKLGLIKTKEEISRYYPHGCSHYIGLDVHDVGHYTDLKANMVITVEPGIYIPAGSPCDKKWWNIGVRIEDDILITKTGHENLSIAAPRTWQDVEKMMAQKSGFSGIVLPGL